MAIEKSYQDNKLLQSSGEESEAIVVVKYLVKEELKRVTGNVNINVANPRGVTLRNKKNVRTS